MNTIDTVYALGQSLWYDNIERRLLENGELAAMISRGEIKGMTSNPTIFHNAIAKSQDYDEQLTVLVKAGLNAKDIYEKLAIRDICQAADILLPLYEGTSHKDGYISLEVSPNLADDAEGTLDEAKRLHKAVNRPNLMIKIPATRAGLPAIRRAIQVGINVNVTLIFSLDRYRQVMDAYLSGLEDRLNAGEPIENIASVASFFVSRMDTKVDKTLDSIIQSSSPDAGQAKAVLGKMAIANAKLAYQEFRKVCASERFIHLHKNGANVQRPLWASTSTKNPSYADTIYVDNLIGAQTVNTLPPQTLVAFRDHGSARLTIEENLPEAQRILEILENLGISIDRVTQELEAEGVKAFADSFKALMDTIEQRRQLLL